MPTYTLKELAQLADVTPRTIRFYIQQGLLPSPGVQGPSTRYADEHLELLRAIKKLQVAHYPLAEIRARLRTMTTDQLADIQDVPTANQASDSAVDYIRRVMTQPRLPAPSAVPHVLARSVAPPPSAAVMPEKEPFPTPTDLHQSPQSPRSQWERIGLDPDIELHVRRPLTRQNTKRVERLITIARQLFEEN